MAHEIETALFVGTPAWHGLGTLLAAPPTADEAIQAAGLELDVSLEALFTGDGQWAPDHRAVRRSSDQAVLGVVGKDYEPLHNRDAFAWFDPFVQSKGAVFESAGSLRGGRHVWILAKLNRDPMWVLPGDAVEKYLLLAHGHDGSMAVHAGFTPIRVVCANTLRLAAEYFEAKLQRIRHTHGMHYTLQELQAIVDLADARFEATAEQYRFLAVRGLDKNDLRAYVNVVWRGWDAKDSVRSGVIRTIEKLNEEGRGTQIPGVRGTWWGAYNAVNEYLLYHRGRDPEVRLDSAWFGEGANMNQRALNVAVAMANKR